MKMGIEKERENEDQKAKALTITAVNACFELLFDGKREELRSFSRVK